MKPIISQKNHPPLYAFKVKEKHSKKTLYFNVKSSSEVPFPSFIPDDETLMKEFVRYETKQSTPTLDKFKIPFVASPIFWTKETDLDRDYVVDVLLNDKFAIRRVLNHPVMKHYVSMVAMSEIQDEFNDPNSPKSKAQFLSHGLELDYFYYSVIEDKQNIEHYKEIVNNKVTLVDEPNKNSYTKAEEETEAGYSLYLRPESGILTCSIHTDRLPDSLAFNDDRIVIKLGDKSLLDICLSLYIDLREPVKFKYDDKSCLFRAVFKVVETQ